MNIPEYHDLVVVGAGAAGLSAAAAASDGGVKDVVIVEKNYEPGGRLNYEKNEEAGKDTFGAAVGSEEFRNRFLRFLSDYEVPVRCGLELNDIASDKEGFILSLEDEEGLPLEMHCRGLILASGNNKQLRETIPAFIEELKKEKAPIYFQVCGDLIELCLLPDEAAKNGAQAGREAADFLRALQN